MNIEQELISQDMTIIIFDYAINNEEPQRGVTFVYGRDHNLRSYPKDVIKWIEREIKCDNITFIEVLSII